MRDEPRLELGCISASSSCQPSDRSSGCLVGLWASSTPRRVDRAERGYAARAIARLYRWQCALRLVRPSVRVWHKRSHFAL